MVGLLLAMAAAGSYECLLRIKSDIRKHLELKERRERREIFHHYWMLLIRALPGRYDSGWKDSLFHIQYLIHNACDTLVFTTYHSVHLPQYLCVVSSADSLGGRGGGGEGGKSPALFESSQDDAWACPRRVDHPIPSKIERSELIAF